MSLARHVKEDSVLVLSILEILLLLTDRTFEVLNLKHYYEEGHLWWMGLTLLCILLPGTLEVLYWVSQLRHCCGEAAREVPISSKGFWKRILLGTLFPISIATRHAAIALKGSDNIRDKYANLRLIKSLQSFAESAPQIVLQSYIVIRTWTQIADHWIQLVCILTGLVMMAKSCAEHHFHEVSRKTLIPGLGDIASSYFYYLSHVFSRTVVFALFFAYYDFYGLIPALLLLIINVPMAATILWDNFFVKTIWTSVAAVLVPVCFVSKHAVEKYKCAEQTFLKFYFWNTIVFILVIFVTTVAFNLLSFFQVIKMYQLELSVLTFGHPMPRDMMGWGTLTWIGLSLIFSLLSGLLVR